MTITKFLKITIIVLLMSLSACTVKEPPKDTIIKVADVLNALKDQLHVNETSVLLTGFDLISETAEGIHVDVLTTFTLENPTGLYDLKASLRFLKTGTIYKLYNVDYETLSAKVYQAPDPNRALEILRNTVDIVTYYNYWSITEEFMDGSVEPMTCDLKDRDFQDGQTDIECVETLKMMDFTGLGTMRVKGTYDFKKSWTYAFDSWSFVKTLEFSQPLKFKFYSYVFEDTSLFKANEVITLTMSGKIILTYQGNETPSADSKMSGTLDHDGGQLVVSVEVIDTAEGPKIGFVYGSQPEDVLFLYIDSGAGRCGPSSPPTYYLKDAKGNYAWLTDSVSQDAGFNTLSETECGA